MNTTDGALGDSGLPRRVLLVDDSVDAAEAMSMLLETLGHEVRVMHDGPSALAMVDEFAPEVVILDIGLPGMNGFEVARDLRTRAVTKSASNCEAERSYFASRAVAAAEKRGSP